MVDLLNGTLTRQPKRHTLAVGPRLGSQHRPAGCWELSTAKHAVEAVSSRPPCWHLDLQFRVTAQHSATNP